MRLEERIWSRYLRVVKRSLFSQPAWRFLLILIIESRVLRFMIVCNNGTIQQQIEDISRTRSSRLMKVKTTHSNGV